MGERRGAQPWRRCREIGAVGGDKRMAAEREWRGAKRPGESGFWVGIGGRHRVGPGGPRTVTDRARNLGDRRDACEKLRDLAADAYRVEHRRHLAPARTARQQRICPRAAVGVVCGAGR